MGKQGAIPSAARAVLSIAILWCLSTCEENPCATLSSPEDFAACPRLCGTDPTASACTLEVLSFPSRVFRKPHDVLFEYSPLNSWAKGYWRMGETYKGLVEILELPFAVGVPAPAFSPQGRLLYPTPSNHPPPQLRSSSTRPEPGRSMMSLYFHYFVGWNACVFEVASVMSWPMQDPESPRSGLMAEFERSSLVMSVEGLCCDEVEDTGFTSGFAWKSTGMIVWIHRSSETPPDGDPDPLPWYPGGVPDPVCGEDGWCNERCEVDYDCPCHDDGVCNVFTCPGDLDCGCGPDSICIPSCGDDPDCMCLADGACSARCGSLDPDCNCVEDGECNPICGWFDPDCWCIEDGICSTCPCRSDPDCPSQAPD